MLSIRMLPIRKPHSIWVSFARPVINAHSFRIAPIRTFHSTKSILSQLHQNANQDFKSSVTQNESNQKPWQRNVIILKSLLKYLWPKDDATIKTRVVVALALLISGKLLNVSVPFLFKNIVDTLNTTDYTTNLSVFTVAGTVLIGYGLARLGANLFQELRNAIFGTVTQRAIRTASGNIFYHLLRLDSNFHLNRQTGGLVRAIDRGSKGINQILSSAIFHLVPTIFEISVVCGILSFQFGGSFAAVTLITMASYTVFTIMTTQWRLKFRKEMNKADNAAASTATDSLLNVEAVQQFNNERFETRRYNESLAKYELAAIKNQSSLSFLNAGQNAIFSISLTMMMWMASHGIITGALSIGDLVLINTLVFQLSMPLNFLGSVYRDTSQSLLDMGTMFNMQKIEGKIEQSEQKPDILLTGGEIEFENVSFSYVEGNPILNNISFKIPAGLRVAFVGPSGCGKSTILRLLSRFFDSDAGNITIDKQSIHDVNVQSLRSTIGTLPQDTILFNQTIYDNIHYGNTSASNHDVYEAAKKAELHDLIMTKFPAHYETHVGERGLMISGGEKQRVQLARLFLKDPSIALFDEPTSALDQTTETKIMTTIKEWLSQPTKTGLRKTAVFIAHRLSTISDCDIIFVLNHGRVVELGNHEQLIEQNGLYSSMWKAQSTHVTIEK
ncbi:P-loop containing nucleoside triphosphate hydrolase protein [Globomyces pollinis-pini]|nr:P-loop containing nucleoside triphosphate hydrolase protein [Globomyces pollinis-pini]